MPDISKPCNAVNSYNYKQDVQDRMGYITGLKIGDTTFTADQAVKDPSDQSEVKAVTVLDSFFWNGGKSDPLCFAGRVSAGNKVEIDKKLHQDMKDTCTIKFEVFEYDPKAKKFFKTIHSNDADLNALIMKQGSDLKISISDSENTDVPEPQNFNFNLEVMPDKSDEQDIHYAVSNTDKFAKPWGVKVG